MLNFFHKTFIDSWQILNNSEPLFSKGNTIFLIALPPPTFVPFTFSIQKREKWVFSKKKQNISISFSYIFSKFSVRFLKIMLRFPPPRRLSVQGGGQLFGGERNKKIKIKQENKMADNLATVHLFHVQFCSSFLWFLTDRKTKIKCSYLWEIL